MKSTICFMLVAAMVMPLPTRAATDPVDLVRGDPAPFSGTLLDPETMRVFLEVTALAKKLDFDLSLEKAARAADVERFTNLLAASERKANAQADIARICSDDLAACASAKSNDGPGWWAVLGAGAVGVAVGVVLMVLIQ